MSNNLLFPSELIWLKLYKLVDFIYFINLMNFNAEFSILFRLHKIFVLLHPTKSHALNGRSDSTPRILTLFKFTLFYNFVNWHYIQILKPILNLVD